MKRLSDLQKSYKIPGFSLMEIVIVIGTISVLAATLTPVALDQIENARVTAALSDTRTILVGINNLREDTQVPVNAAVPIQSTAGAAATAITGANWAGVGTRATGGILIDHLINNTIGAGDYYTALDPTTGVGWNGPYIMEDPVDPWGTNYYISTNWIISVGSSRILQSNSFVDPVTALNPNANDDDIGTMWCPNDLTVAGATTC